MNAILHSDFEAGAAVAATLADLLLRLETGPSAEARTATDRLGDLAVDFRLADEKPGQGLSSWQRRKVIRDIEENLGGTLRVAELAKGVGLCESHFGREFKTSFGMTPYAYVISRRLALARTLMSTTDLPLSEIALAVGLNDQPHLCTLFRQAFGATPGRWRAARSTNNAMSADLRVGHLH
ncbi:helix-turn-helix transcriptional regulator [Rhizobium sp. TRM95796]|uniref:helix-turn-helix transcriptional regulator n=1 Tax=Rhizobium sp. TRM95796 TaxID=2979862 RepID=UPI0021E7AFDA|nr:AraC family transcriptional regulator [Rhizobium sp. TRM95796]MCV3765140.1 AraC family transcriptional regulator [Rhizobium sp. TRM95796]